MPPPEKLLLARSLLLPATAVDGDGGIDAAEAVTIGDDVSKCCPPTAALLLPLLELLLALWRGVRLGEGTGAGAAAVAPNAGDGGILELVTAGADDVARAFNGVSKKCGASPSGLPALLQLRCLRTHA